MIRIEVKQHSCVASVRKFMMVSPFFTKVTAMLAVFCHNAYHGNIFVGVVPHEAAMSAFMRRVAKENGLHHDGEFKKEADDRDETITWSFRPAKNMCGVYRTVPVDVENGVPLAKRRLSK